VPDCSPPCAGGFIPPVSALRFQPPPAPAILPFDDTFWRALSIRPVELNRARRTSRQSEKPDLPGKNRMDSELILYSVSRILHVATAIVVVGGTFFVRFVLFPAAAQNLTEDVHARLRSAVMAKWKRMVHVGIGLFLLTGGLNYYRVFAKGTHPKDPLYHALLGTKIILALVIFFLASVLVGRSPAFEGLRRSAPRWLLVNLLLAAVIIAISGFLRVRGP
jgi:hypothetical protein